MRMFDHEWRTLGANDPGAALTHGFAIVAAVVLLVLLIMEAVARGGAAHIVGVVIFAASMITAYGVSTAYHLIPASVLRAKVLLQRLDHSAIFLLIAGTYTPVCITLLKGPWGYSMLAVVGGLAVLGSAIKLSGVATPPWITPIISLIMGWVAIVAIVPLVRALPPEGLVWLFGGGVAYSLGVVFFALEHRMRRTK